MFKGKATVIGAGILGIAAANTLSKLGYQTTVIERSLQAKGSSIRNFGMVWPIGQHPDRYYERAIKSRNIWLELCILGKIWHNPIGSIQLFTNEIELELANDFYNQNKEIRQALKLLNRNETLKAVENANPLTIVGGMFSDTEVIVESRQAIRILPQLLSETQNIQFIFGKTAIEANSKFVKTSDGSIYESDVVFVCSGFDIHSLYPETYAKAPITISQLNMLRSFPIDHKIPALCGGLSFLHYDSYSSITGLNQYSEFCKQKYPNQVSNGIHLLVSQNEENCLTIGDSHQYGLHHDPFQESLIDDYILEYYNELFVNHDLKISQRWTGEYLKMTNGSSEWVEQIEPGVFIFNGPGGAGMTLGFGMAEEIIPTLI